MNMIATVFGTKSSREIKGMRPLIEKINGLEPQMQAMSDEELAGQTEKFRKRLEAGETLDDILPEAFATVREASWRTIGMRHYDVQLIGGIALHRGEVAEMKTGEGKTLVATLAVYLNALAGKGVHVITVNDYLAKRDSEWMGQVYHSLGMNVGAITHGLNDVQRKAAYDADITYGTNNEFGFDYLRDNMKFNLDGRVQRGHPYAVIDEVDSVLIDEARTPLIISGPSNEPTDMYYKANRIVPFLTRGEVFHDDDPDLRTTTGDYTVDEKDKTVTLTEEGTKKVNEMLGLDGNYDVDSMIAMNYVQVALKAHELFVKDRDYVVKDGEIVIVDEFTGRLMPGRRWSDGLHQAVEAKEDLQVQAENQTLATVTLQNYFRMYDKLSGMTGTADTDATELESIYKMGVLQIPTNKPLLREEFNDVIYGTEAAKFRAVAREAKALQEKGQPVLIGTVSVEKSEELSALLTEMGVTHQVLNAKNNEREAAIVAQAGRKGAVTVSTNMAGRGTDIVLGGNPEFLAVEELVRQGKQSMEEVTPEEWEAALAAMKAQAKKEHEEVKALGGLHVIGTERHESRRIDNQLRGRAGRQGDPGSSRFYLSLEDHLVRLFGGDRLKGVMQKLGMEEDEPIESRMVSKSVAGAQKKVEDRNFDARKNLLEYDDIMNIQRKIVYSMRDQLLEDPEARPAVDEMIPDVLNNIMDKYASARSYPETWNWKDLEKEIREVFGPEAPIDKMKGLKREDFVKKLGEKLVEAYQEKEAAVGTENLRAIEQAAMLHIIDEAWKDHLFSIDLMKQGIGLRGYAQKDPLVEYKREAYEMFVGMMNGIDRATVSYLSGFKMAAPEEVMALQAEAAAEAAVTPAPEPVVEPVAEPVSEPAKKQQEPVAQPAAKENGKTAGKTNGKTGGKATTFGDVAKKAAEEAAVAKKPEPPVKTTKPDPKKQTRPGQSGT